MRHDPYLSQRASIALDRFLCGSAADPRIAKGLDRLARDIARADGDGVDAAGELPVNESTVRGDETF